MFYGGYVENLIVNWLVVFTRSVLLNRKHGNRYLIYRHEDLVDGTSNIMKQLSQGLGLQFNDSLVSPTVAGIEWSGNSMYAKTKGLDKSLAKTRDVFTEVEEELIDKYCSEITNYLTSFSGRLVDLANISESMLFDYEHQEKYMKSREQTALYFASMYERWKYEPMSSVLKNAFRKKPKLNYL